MATYRTSYPGNTALQQEVWTLPLLEAQAVLPFLDTRIGTYWETVILKPTRRAKRIKVGTVTVYTAGFSTSDLATALRASGSTVRSTN